MFPRNLRRVPVAVVIGLLLGVCLTPVLGDVPLRSYRHEQERLIRAQRHQRGLMQEEASNVMPNVAGMEFDLQDGMSLTVSQSVLEGPSQVVTISWTNVPFVQDYDWIAAYSPVPETMEGYSTQLPVKFMNLTQARTNGSTEMWLLHMRESWVFAYMRGGYDKPTMIGLSEPVHYVNQPSQYNMPMQIHLARTVDPSEMTVIWVTKNETDPLVIYASSLELLSTNPSSVSANTSTYTRDEMCDGIAGGVGWRDPGSIHQAVLTNLQPGQQYFYMIMGADAVSTVQSFYAPPKPGSDIDFIIFGDMGQAQFDGTAEWIVWRYNTGKPVPFPDQPAVLNTTKSLRLDLTDGSVSNETAIILIIGDVSYARGRGGMWDQFHYLIEPFSVNTPIMTLLGNHEMNWAKSYWSSKDSGGECGVPYQSRFPMPSPPSSSPPVTKGFSASPFYSFDHGAVHFVMMSTEHDFSRSSEQYAWLEADLANVDRSVTPWVLMSGHRPMYVSSSDGSSKASDMVVAEFMREQLEDLLQQYQVDVFFAGHHHDYQRTCPVYNSTCVNEADRNDEFDVSTTSSSSTNFGTVHILTGASGMWNNVYLNSTDFAWLKYAEEYVHGYSRVRVRGNSLTIDFIASDDRKLWDSITITKGVNGTTGLFTTSTSRNKSPIYQPDAFGDEELEVESQVELGSSIFIREEA